MATADLPEDSQRLDLLDHRVRALEKLAATVLGLPVHGSREHLIELGFALTDESRAWAKQALADMKARHANTDWPALRERLGFTRDGSAPALNPAPVQLASLEARVERLEQHLRRLGELPGE